MDLTVRQSAVTAYIDTCPLRTQLDYGLGVPRPTGPKPVALFVGNIFHLTYAEAYRAKLDGVVPGVNELVDMAEEFFRLRTVAEGEDPIEEVEWGDKTEAQHLVDVIALVQAYYPVFLRTEPKVVEHALSKRYEVWIDTLSKETIPDGPHGVTVTTRLDLGTTNGWVIDLKTAKAYSRKGGGDFFYGYGAEDVIRKSQPFIHLALLGKVTPYAFHIVGKNDTGHASLQQVSVPHSQHQVDTWEQRTLVPALTSISAGVFPARMGSFCSYCSYRTDRNTCGLFAS